MAVPQVFFCIPGDLSLPTGGYAYDRRVLDLADKFGLDLRHLALPGSYPAPSATDLRETARLIRETPADAILLIDGLAYGAMPSDLVTNFKRRVVALVHHPLGLENGIGEERARELIASETAALALAEKIIVTSPLTARTLARDFAVPETKITVAEPGVDPSPRAQGSPPGAPLRLLAVGSLVPRKGYDILLRALRRTPFGPWRKDEYGNWGEGLPPLQWELRIVGALDRSPAALFSIKEALGLPKGRPITSGSDLSIRTQVGVSNAGGAIIFRGALSDAEVATEYAAADLFVMPSLYEGYGMVIAEAMAHGLPIVSTTGGALAETVPDNVAIKVPPGDADALADALLRMMTEPALRKSLADASWAAGQTLPRWDDTARRIATVLKGMMTG